MTDSISSPSNKLSLGKSILQSGFKLTKDGILNSAGNNRFKFERSLQEYYIFEGSDECSADSSTPIEVNTRESQSNSRITIQEQKIQPVDYRKFKNSKKDSTTLETPSSILKTESAENMEWSKIPESNLIRSASSNDESIKNSGRFELKPKTMLEVSSKSDVVTMNYKTLNSPLVMTKANLFSVVKESKQLEVSHHEDNGKLYPKSSLMMDIDSSEPFGKTGRCLSEITPEGYKEEERLTQSKRLEILTPIRFERNADYQSSFNPKTSQRLENNADMTISRDRNKNINAEVEDRLEAVPPTRDRNNVVGNTVIPIPQPSQTGEEYVKLEEKLFLAKNLGFLFGIGLLAATVLLEIHQIISFHWIFGTLYIYLLYSILEAISININYKRDSRLRREDFLDILQKISITVFIFVLHLKLSEVIELTNHSFIPMLISTIAYALFSKARTSIQIEKAFMNSIFFLQAICINLQVDSELHFGWDFVVILAWIYLGASAIYFAGYLTVLIFLSTDCAYKFLTCQPICHINELIGMLWNTLYHSLSIFGILIAQEVFDTLDPISITSVLQKECKDTLVVTIILIIITLLNFNRLVQFFYNINNRNNNLTNYPLVDEENTRESPVELQVEKKSSYFIMLSSTYFLPFQNLSLIKDQRNTARIKRVLSRLGFWKIGSLQQNKQAKSKGPIDLATLKRYKTALDSKFGSKTQLSSSAVPSFRISTKKKSSAENKTDLKKPKPVNNTPRTCLDIEKSAPKPYFSSNDIDNVRAMNILQSPSRTLDEICYICCSEAANAVLMSCGHAGVCYECASLLLKKNGLCMECRGKIEAIHKIDPKIKFSGIVRGVEIGTIAKS